MQNHELYKLLNIEDFKDESKNRRYKD